MKPATRRRVDWARCFSADYLNKSFVSSSAWDRDARNKGRGIRVERSLQDICDVTEFDKFSCIHHGYSVSHIPDHVDVVTDEKI